MRVFEWFQRVSKTAFFVSVISLQEIRFGIELMSQGRKRDRLETWLTYDLPRHFAGRLLAVDERIADEAGILTAMSKKKGAEAELADALIAATAKVHKLRLATLNREHFERLGVEMVTF